MSSVFRLGMSGSCFIYVMPQELLKAAYGATKTERPAKFDDRLNSMMAGFMRNMMDAVNASGIAAMECYHSICWDSERILEVMLDKPNVEFWSVHAPYGRFMDPSSLIEEYREGAVEAYCDAVKAAKRIGAQVVVAHPGANVEYDVPRELQLEASIEPLRRIADAAGESGIRIAVEPLPKNEPGNTLDEVLWMVEHIDRPNVGINFDVNHLFPPEAIPGLIRKAGNLIESVHISDQDGIERHWMPFEGTLDWREILAALADAGYKGPLMYETHVRGKETCKEVAQAVIENYDRLIALAPASVGSRGA